MFRLTVFVLGTFFVLTSSFPQPRPHNIRFNENGKLRLLNFADLHYGEKPSGEGPINDSKSTEVIRKVLAYEKPDFVVFTGDQVTGDGFSYPNASAYVDMIVRPLVEGGYRWATTYGNHDIGPNVARTDLLAAEQRYSLSYTQGNVYPELVGLTNYYIPIFPPASSANQDPVMIFWFFDSQGGYDSSGLKPVVVDETVVAWFISQSNSIKSRWGPLPALAFFHIPTIQYGPVQSSVANRDECVGMVGEVVNTQYRDTGLMDALADSGTVKSTFVGHDHLNSWCCFYKTLQVCYNRHTGYGGYGNRERGGRVVELDINNLEGIVPNYLRLEDGNIIDHFPAHNGDTDTVVWLRSPRITNFGGWGTQEFCPQGSFVNGFRLKVQLSQGPLIDDTALNGIELLCTEKEQSTSRPKDFVPITSKVGGWGAWGGYFECVPGEFAIGFQLRSEGVVLDNTAANNLIMRCSSGRSLTGNGMSWGNWSPERSCPAGFEICGIWTQVEDPKTGTPPIDNTALNNVDMACCKV